MIVLHFVLLLLWATPQLCQAVSLLRSTSINLNTVYCASLPTCFACLNNPRCGYCSFSKRTHSDQRQRKGGCMAATRSGAPLLQRCHSGWIISPLKKNRIAQLDDAHMCKAIQPGSSQTEGVREELFVEGELLGLVSRACVPCTGFWPHCDCSARSNS